MLIVPLIIILVCLIGLLFMMSSEDSAPEFELEALGNASYNRGDIVKLSQFEGQPVVINFWYPSCGSCVQEMLDIETIFQKPKNQEIRFVSIQLMSFLDSAEDGQEFIDRYGITYPVLLSPTDDLARSYGIKIPPYTVFLNNNHEIVKKWDGVLTSAKIEQILSEFNLLTGSH